MEHKYDIEIVKEQVKEAEQRIFENIYKLDEAEEQKAPIGDFIFLLDNLARHVKDFSELLTTMTISIGRDRMEEIVYAEPKSKSKG